MVRILLNGAAGRMGRVVAELASQNPNMQVVAGVDAMAQGQDLGFPLFDSLEACTVQADVLVDFSRPAALKDILPYACEHMMPVVLATTGYTPGDLERIHRAATRIPVFRSANMSMGINLMIDLLKTCAGALGESCDIEIVEAHHRGKADAPSGTALLLADEINSVYQGGKEYTYGRHSKTDKRGPREIGIHAVRGGSVVGEHAVMFLMDNELVEVRHSAQSRSIFAVGALKAAEFIRDKAPGMYSMRELLAEQKEVTKVLAERGVAMVSLHGLSGWKQAVAALDSLAKARISVDMISQNGSELSFSVQSGDRERAVATLRPAFPECQVESAGKLAKLTVQGVGMEGQPGVAARVFGMLMGLGMEPKMVSTSVTEITLLVDEAQEYRATDALAKHFGIA